MFLEFLLLFLVQRHVFGEGYRSTDLEVAPPNSLGLPTRTLESGRGVSRRTHVGPGRIVLDEHESEVVVDRADESKKMQR